MDYVDDESRLAVVAEALRGTPLLAADTEAAGFHRYFDRACLLQLSTREDTYVVDTLAVRDLSPLAGIFKDPDTEIIFHDADFDLRLLDRDFGITVRTLFDTKIAAQFLGEAAIGLASLVDKFLDVTLEKAYQRADWARRPLPQPMLEYAAKDTRYLPALRNELREALQREDRLHWAEEEFELEEATRWSPPPPDDDAFLRVKGTRDLEPRQLAVLREVFAWRDAVARERDVATFRVLSNQPMVEVARRMPETPRGLASIPGMPRSLPGRYGADVVAAIRRAKALPQDELPVRRRGPGRPPPDPAFEELFERLRSARNEVALDLGLDRGFLMPRSQLEILARERPTTLEEVEALPGFRRWQVEAAGEAMLGVLGT